MTGLKLFVAKELIMGWRRWRARIRKVKAALPMVESLAEDWPKVAAKIRDLTTDADIRDWVAHFDQLRALLHRTK